MWARDNQARETAGWMPRCVAGAAASGYGSLDLAGQAAHRVQSLIIAFL